MSKAATAVTKTADNAINFLRFMTLSFRDLSFGRDTMDGAPDGPTADFMRGVIRWLTRSEEHTSELQSRLHLVCRLLLEKKKIRNYSPPTARTFLRTIPA